MSGIPCIVVASGNRLQSIVQTSFKTAPGWRAMYNARALCTFGFAYGSDAPVFSAAQQQRAADMMQAFNASPTHDSLQHFVELSDALIAEVAVP